MRPQVQMERNNDLAQLMQWALKKTDYVVGGQPDVPV